MQSRAGWQTDSSTDVRVRHKGVLILCVSSFDRMHLISKQVAEALPDREVLFVATEPHANVRYVNLFDGYDPAAPDLCCAADNIRLDFNLEPAKLYRSDFRFWDQPETEDILVGRTLWTLRRVKSLLDEHDIGYVFMTGGGSLETNSVFELANQLPSVRSFRIYPFHYLSVEGGRAKYFFADNNNQRLPLWPETDLESERYRRSWEEAGRYIEAVRTGHFQPDRHARATARNNIFTPKFFGMLRSAAAHLVEIAKARLRGRPVRRTYLDRVYSFFRKCYLDLTHKDPALDESYFIYVLHHPKDSQLLLRGRQFIDQMALCRLLASNLPTGANLLIKEHPIYPGMIPIGEIRRIRSLYRNVQYVDYSVPFADIVGKASGVITVNSTAGLEAAILGVPVVTLGEGFYCGAPFARSVSNLADLTDTLGQLMVHRPESSLDDVQQVLARLFYHSESAEDLDDSAVVDCISRGILARVNA